MSESLYGILTSSSEVNAAEYNFRSAERFYAEGNYGKAFSLYMLSANAGFSAAQVNVGLAYDNGEGVAKNPYEAFKWYTLAANQGNSDGQFNLGICYAEGLVVKQDIKEAERLFVLAAKQGNPQAQHNVAGYYDQLNNYDESITWYRKAAENGYPPSQFNLAVCYLKGEGVNRDDGQALFWLRRAANEGFEPAIRMLRQVST